MWHSHRYTCQRGRRRPRRSRNARRRTGYGRRLTALLPRSLPPVVVALRRTQPSHRGLAGHRSLTTNRSLRPRSPPSLGIEQHGARSGCATAQSTLQQAGTPRPASLSAPPGDSTTFTVSTASSRCAPPLPTGQEPARATPCLGPVLVAVRDVGPGERTRRRCFIERHGTDDKSPALPLPTHHFVPGWFVSVRLGFALPMVVCDGAIIRCAVVRVAVREPGAGARRGLRPRSGGPSTLGPSSG